MSSFARLLASCAFATALLMVPVVARAQQARNLTGDSIGGTQSPFRGSILVYEPMQLTALSLVKSAEPMWDPYYAHQLTLRPEWHPSKSFFLRGNFSLTQELTIGDAQCYEDGTCRSRQVVWSDLMVDGIYPGWTEPKSKIRLGGSLRVVLPVSKASWAATLNFAVSPAVTATRNFAVLEGLIVGYTGRLGVNSNRSATSKLDVYPIEACKPGLGSCDSLLYTGGRNVSWNVTHGPMVVLMPTEPLSFTAMLTQTRSQLYPLSTGTVPTATGPVTIGESSGTNARWSQMAMLDATYTVSPDLYLSFGAYTWASQLAPDGTRRNPIVNRNTSFYFDIGVDVERFTARLQGRKL